MAREFVQLELGLSTGEITSHAISAKNGSMKELYLLLSLRPPYYYQMKAGTKKYEYRIKFVQQPTTTFLYLGATPLDPLSGSIPAKVQFGVPIVDHPSRIGELAESQKPGSSASILQYMADREKGYAIPVLSVEEIETVKLAELKARFPHFCPPQSYMVLNNYPDLLAFLLERSCTRPDRLRSSGPVTTNP
jgi:predicted transcriptional regulator